MKENDMQRINKWPRRLMVTMVIMTMMGMTAILLLRNYATPTVRSDIQKSLYTVGDKNYEIALADERNIVKLGRLPLGIYPGGLAFGNPDEAYQYLVQSGKIGEGWKVFLLSGDFDLDTVEVNGKRYTNKSLLVIEGVSLLKSHVELNYVEFDQTPNSGWRKWADDGKYAEAAKRIMEYLGSHSNLTENQIRNLRFHAGQMNAYAGDYETAIKQFGQCILSEEPKNSPIRWNAYVYATIAFLEEDLDTLQACRLEIEAGPKIGETVPNLDVVESLIENFGQSYQTAYDRHRGITRRPNNDL